MTSPPECTRATVTSQRPDKMNAEPAPDRGYAPPQRVTAYPAQHTLGAARVCDALHHDGLAEVALRLQLSHQQGRHPGRWSAAAVKPDRSAVIEVPEALEAVRKPQGPTRIVVGHTA